jgi:hypothetical protein
MLSNPDSNYFQSHIAKVNRNNSVSILTFILEV